jgi:chromosome partitioning protein
MPETKILTVTGYKGGTAKSTTAIHIAAYFATLGKTVLIDGDPNRTALEWSERGELPFTVTTDKAAHRFTPGAHFLIIDTPARPNSKDLKELAEGCDLLILPTTPDVVSLQPMLEMTRAIEGANYRALLTIVPPLPNREGEIMHADLKESGVPIFNAMIRRTVHFGKAALQGKLISGIAEATAQAAWQDYVNLGNEIRRLIK